MKLHVLADGVKGWHLNIPNYPVFDRAGHLYVSESGDFGKRLGRLFRFDLKGQGRLWAGGDLVFANGLALDNREEFLYVVESFLPEIARYRILPDGIAGPRELFIDGLREVPEGLPSILLETFTAPATLPLAYTESARITRRPYSLKIQPVTSYQTAQTLHSAAQGLRRYSRRIWGDGTSRR